jgi:hypothetical protein
MFQKSAQKHGLDRHSDAILRPLSAASTVLGVTASLPDRTEQSLNVRRRNAAHLNEIMPF